MFPTGDKIPFMSSSDALPFFNSGDFFLVCFVGDARNASRDSLFAGTSVPVESEENSTLSMTSGCPLLLHPAVLDSRCTGKLNREHFICACGASSLPWRAWSMSLTAWGSTVPLASLNGSHCVSFDDYVVYRNDVTRVVPHWMR